MQKYYTAAKIWLLIGLFYLGFGIVKLLRRLHEMFKKTGLILLAIVFVASCATIPQDTPDPTKPEQCFESKFNPYRLLDWKWEQPIPTENFYVFVNPEVGSLPDYVLATVHPVYGTLWRYSYLDGRKVMGYKFDQAKQCYATDPELTPEIEQMLHETLLKLRNGHEV